MGRIIAIDYGKKKCGIAVTDPSGRVPQPYGTIPSKELFFWLAEYVKREGRENIECIVMGKPAYWGADTSGMERRVQEVAREIETRTGIPVKFVDEVYTSRWAEAMMKFHGVHDVGRRREWRDKLSAYQILSTFLEMGSGDGRR